MGKFRILKIFKLFGLYYNFIKLLIRVKPDIVLLPISQTTIGFIKDSVFIILSLFFRNVNILTQLRGSNFRNWLNNSPVLIRKFTRWILSKTTGVIVLGDILRPLFKDYYPDDRIFVVANGGDFNIPERSRKNKETIRIAHISNFIPAKGFWYVLTALSIIKRMYSNIELVAMGSWYDPAYQTKCENLISDQQLPVRIISPSEKQSEKYDLLANADIFIFTPVAPEGHPWVLIEAIAAGLPVIATAQGAIEQNVHDGVNGFIVPSGNADVIASKLMELIAEPEKRKEMSLNSKRIYEEKFTEKAMIKKLEEVLQEIILLKDE